jgi:hypothetical protein
MAGQVGLFLGSMGVPIEDLRTISNNPSDSSLHRSRKLDTAIGKHRRDPEKLAYLARIRPDLGEMLAWVSQTYDYDVSL